MPKTAKLTTGRRHMTTEQRNQCVRLYQEGYTIKYLADYYDRHATIIGRLIRQRGVKRGNKCDRPKLAPGVTVQFTVSNPNTGPTRFNSKVVHLHKGGKPLQAGDLVPGQVVTFNIETGEVKDEDLDGTKGDKHA